MNFYKILGVDKDATRPEIKKAYKRLAMKYHPDRDGGDKAEFEKIKLAYDVLVDPVRRERYDKNGTIDKPDDIQQEANNMLVTLFNLEIDTYNFNKNIIKSIRETLRKAIEHADETKHSIKCKIKKLEQAKERIECKLEFNVFSELCDSKIAHMRVEIQSIEHKDEVARMALKILNKYKDSTPESSTYRSSLFGAGLYNTTTT